MYFLIYWFSCLRIYMCMDMLQVYAMHFLSIYLLVTELDCLNLSPAQEHQRPSPGETFAVSAADSWPNAKA